MGNVSDKIAQMSDDEIQKALGSSGYGSGSKAKLIGNIRRSDEQLNVLKSNYGNGISVKGIMANISGHHYLHIKEKKREMGKDWDDNKVQTPSDADPLDTSVFFHAKRDGAAMGSRAGMRYEVVDRSGFKKGVISIAWENPWSGKFVYCIMVSNHDNLLQACLDHCQNSS